MALIAGAGFFAFWACKILIVAAIPSYLRAWELGNWSGIKGSSVVFLAALYLTWICCRSAWAMLHFLRQPAEKVSFRSLLRTSLF
jgi:hypothetical protein